MLNSFCTAHDEVDEVMSSSSQLYFGESSRSMGNAPAVGHLTLLHRHRHIRKICSRHPEVLGLLGMDMLAQKFLKPPASQEQKRTTQWFQGKNGQFREWNGGTVVGRGNSYDHSTNPCDLLGRKVNCLELQWHFVFGTVGLRDTGYISEIAVFLHCKLVVKWCEMSWSFLFRGVLKPSSCLVSHKTCYIYVT